MFSEDLSVFFDVEGGFAELITLNGQADLPGIVQAGMQNALLQEPGPGGYSPTVLMQADHIPASVAGKSLTVQTGTCAGSYKVAGHDPDGTGMVTLYLTKA